MHNNAAAPSYYSFREKKKKRQRPRNFSGDNGKELTVLLAATRLIENRKNCIIINDLPDELLIYILSFLPTKDVFRTRILSSRWKNLWTMVPNLVFKPNNEDEDCKYMGFIERVLVSHNSNFNQFHIECTAQIEISHFLKYWISIAVQRNVQEIYLIYYDKHMQLPQSLFTCKTLVSLKLRSGLYLDNFPSSIYFPSLKVLDIILSYPSSDLTQKLFCSSPVLEELSIHANYRNSGEYIYNISSPFLKKLFVSIITDSRENFDCVVNVDAPVLESLTLEHVFNARFVLNSLSALKKARLISFEKGNDLILENLFTLLESVSYVKDLSLGGYLTMIVLGISIEKWPAIPIVMQLTLDISDNFDSKSFSRWPIFPKLINLRLDLHWNFDFKDFPKILSSAPNLTTLVIKKIFSSDEFNSLEEAEGPNCLRTHVKQIELLAFQGCHGELTMIKYLLENALVLEKLTVNIWCNSGLVKEWFKKEIGMLPRSSKKCRFLFT